MVADADVAAAIESVEQRNGLPHGGLRQKLEAQAVSFSTLISQMRISLGWTRVLRQELSLRGYVSPAEIDEQERIFKQQVGQPQYHVAEIFVAAEDPSRLNDARKFADTVIQQLRAGAPFGIVAAEFSQSETALKGGDLAGCGRISWISRSRRWCSKCRWARSATRCGWRAGSRSLRCRTSGFPATIWRPC
ncbi:MAG: peptidylprolyl isomerase [Rhodospirillales bacterium]